MSHGFYKCQNFGRSFLAASFFACVGFFSCLLSNQAMASNEGPPSATTTRVNDDAIIKTINELSRAAWKAGDVSPSKPAPDGAWARRVYIDVLGRIPTIDELEAYLAITKGERKAWLVERLLGSEYSKERSRARATEWTNLLIGRTGGTRNNSPIHRDSFVGYLRDSFHNQKPMNQLMKELVTASGSVRPEDEDHNPAANYLADKMGENGVQATAKTSQLFLGVAVQCTQCHNHPFNEFKQNQFWEMNAFFRQTRAERIRDEDDNRRYVRIVDRDYRGEGPQGMTAPGTFARAESFYELRNGRVKVAYPVFLDGTSLSEKYADQGEGFGDSGRLNDVNRREELATLIAESPEFPMALVNREWGRLFGSGFTKPVEDMGPHNPPTHPELLAELANAFRDSGYDLDRLTRWIIMSDPYALDSRPTRSNDEDEPSQGVSPLFSRFYLRQMTAEQIYDSLITATQADQAVSEENRDRARQRWLRQFTTAFGNDENGEATSFNGSIPQALAMMNSDLMRQATAIKWSTKQGSSMSYGKDEQGFLSEIAEDRSLTNADRVKKLYLAAFARFPTRSELALCNKMLVAREGNAAEALRDIWWALLNSNEFILQH